MSRGRLGFIETVLVASALFSAANVLASEYPVRPVRWIIGYPPGGASDVLVRIVAQRLSRVWNQQVVVDNRPGATGMIAAEMAANASPDGYTIFLGDISTHAINQSLYKRLPYKPIEEFAPITKIGVVPNIVVVSPSSVIRSISDLIKLAKDRPGTLNYASGGNGTGTHLATELFKISTATDLTHVPYKGTPPALIELAAGAVQIMFAGAPPALPLVRTKKLRGIAVTTSDRFDLLPQVPTVAETLAGYEASTWYGLFSPKGTPKSVIAVLNAHLIKILSDSEVRDILREQGFNLNSSTPEEFSTFIQAEARKYAVVVRERGLRLD